MARGVVDVFLKGECDPFVLTDFLNDAYGKLIEIIYSPDGFVVYVDDSICFSFYFGYFFLPLVQVIGCETIAP